MFIESAERTRVHDDSRWYIYTQIILRSDYWGHFGFHIHNFLIIDFRNGQRRLEVGKTVQVLLPLPLKAWHRQRLKEDITTAKMWSRGIYVPRRSCKFSREVVPTIGADTPMNARCPQDSSFGPKDSYTYQVLPWPKLKQAEPCSRLSSRRAFVPCNKFLVKTTCMENKTRTYASTISLLPWLLL